MAIIMNVNFRQGIVKIPKDNLSNQLFLQKTGANVDLLTYNGSTKVNFCHYDRNYLHTEHNNTLSAWVGPFLNGTDYWLYWDINTKTALRTFGYSLYAPIVQSTAPVSPATNQMWFDTTTNTMKEYSGNAWIVVIRVIACKLSSGTVIQPWNGGSYFEGTQVGSNVSNDTGSIVYDLADTPLRRSDNTFYTTTDELTTGIDVISSLKLETLHFDAQASTNMTKFTVVVLKDFDIVEPAKYGTTTDVVYGLTQSDVSSGQRVSIVTSGVVTDVSWNWPQANALMYYDATGQLTTTIRPGISPIGFVIEPTKILLTRINGSSSSNNVGNGSVQGYPLASGSITLDTGIFWHTIEQDGVLDIEFTAPTGNSISQFNIEIISNGDTINWPGTLGSTSLTSGLTAVFNVTFRPIVQGIPARFTITQSNLY
jgi:hypothetical protein